MNGDPSRPTDAALSQAYQEHLDLDVAPRPPLDEVAARIVQRRRRRRGVAVAGSAGLVAAAAIVVVQVGGGDGDARKDVAGPSEGVLTVTKADGSTFIFSEFRITCEPDTAGRESVLVTSGPDQLDGDLLPAPIFYFEVPVENAAGEARTYELPAEREPRADQPDLGDGVVLEKGVPPITDPKFVMFVATEQTTKNAENNEVSSSKKGSEGTLEVGGASCGADPSIDFTVHGTLGSEVDQPPLQIDGEIHLE